MSSDQTPDHSIHRLIQDSEKRYPADLYLIGFSGGMDSTVLLHAYSQIVDPSKLKAVYINHGLQSDTKHWAEHCKSLCAQLNVACDVIDLELDTSSGDSIEELARNARYQAFSSYMTENTVLLTAHHANDQAETFMLNALRGSGVSGLAAMPEAKPFHAGLHHRPLLAATREHLHDYAQKTDLKWIEDPSNSDDKFNRNYLRKHIMPVLERRWSKMATTLSRSARLMSESELLSQDLAEIDLGADFLSGKPLFYSDLLGLSLHRRLNALRYWLKGCLSALPSKAVLLEIDSAMFAAEDANPKIEVGPYLVQRYNGALYCEAKLNYDPSAEFEWDIQESLVLDTGVELKPGDLGQLLPVLLEENAVLQLRYRQGGERIQLPGRNHQHRVKKLLQEQGVPPWKREQLPLVYYKNQLIAVLGLENSILADLEL